VTETRFDPDTQFSKARIETLCDGVFAIAMTLLVLELKVPDLPRPAAPAALWHALGEHRLGFFAFALSFMLAGAFWMQHHVLFHYLARATRPLALLNLVFLMFVSFLPFSTSLFATYGAGGIAFYFGNQFVLAVLLALHWTLAQRQGLLHGASDDPKRRRFAALMAAFPAVFGLLFVISIFRPQSAGIASLPAMVVILIIRRVAERRARAVMTS
jgi:TMEM175 potassium channel family protein